MVLINDISQLDYYQYAGIDWSQCYCEPVLHPSDILLQSQVPGYSSTTSYSLKVEVMTVDGLTVLEDASSSFIHEMAVANYTAFINVTATRITDIMCSQKCFILALTLRKNITIMNTDGTVVSSTSLVFKKYTQRYCVEDCCILAGDIDINVSSGEYAFSDYSNEYDI